MNLDIANAAKKEVALTFDDAPIGSSQHFDSNSRTEELIKKLKALEVPAVMIFANACRKKDFTSVITQLKKYREAGHLIENHTCSHLRLDDVGFTEFTKDILHGDELLSPLHTGQKFFRYPYLNEGNDTKLRDQTREWLKTNHFKNALVSIDDNDYIFSLKMNEAKRKKKKIDYKKVQELFIKHIISAAQFNDNLAIKTIGRSPKHVLLLHEMDATVMFLDSLVNELRLKGWTIISAEEAFKDSIYSETPKNTYSGNGIIAQLAFEKTGEKIGHNFDETNNELNRILDLENKK